MKSWRVLSVISTLAFAPTTTYAFSRVECQPGDSTCNPTSTPTPASPTAPVQEKPPATAPVAAPPASAQTPEQKPAPQPAPQPAPTAPTPVLGPATVPVHPVVPAQPATPVEPAPTQPAAPQTPPQAPMPSPSAPVIIMLAPPRPLPLMSARDSRFGLHAHFGIIASDEVQLAGLTGAFRYKPLPMLALDFGLGTYGGTDSLDLDRVEIPLSFNGLFFFNPRGRWQLYLIGGTGIVFSQAEGFASDTDEFESTDRTYVHFEGGLGTEMSLARGISLSADIRAFVRDRVHSSEEDATLIEAPDGATIQKNDRTEATFGGAIFTLGLNFYF